MRDHPVESIDQIGWPTLNVIAWNYSKNGSRKNRLVIQLTNKQSHHLTISYIPRINSKVRVLDWAILGRCSQSFLGCIDPSEPFQCPQSEKCIALQFICDGHPGDCPGNTDENEETCIAGES